MAGIEPAAATLARRARYLSCHPQGRRGDAAAAVPAGTAGLPVVLTLWTSQFAITFPHAGW